MAQELKPGDRFLERFQIEYLAAEGGMASIYVASDQVTGHQIGVKSLYPYYADNKTIVSRFLEEGRIQQELRHPNILRVFQVIETPVLAILMEFVQGPTLDEFLAQHGTLSKQEIIDVIIPAMSAVGFAHSRGIIHRDIKPSNILLHHGDIRTPKILDFGVAKVKGAGGQDLTATGTTVGTLHYMSPEQITGSKNIDGRADIYSLGVTMYKLVAGEVPFNAPTEFALMMAQVEAQPLPPSELNPTIDADLEAVILKAMEKRPSERYQTIKEFTSALLDIRLGAGLSVEQSLSTSISSEILNMALMADEIATDTPVQNVFAPPAPIDVTMEPSTLEIEQTLQTTKPEQTVELGSSAMLHLSQEDVNAIDNFAGANEETEDMRSLADRMPKIHGLQNTKPELGAFTEQTRPSRESLAPVDQDVTQRDKPQQPATRPSRPRALPPLETRPSRIDPAIDRRSASSGHNPPPQVDPDEDIDTVSIQQRINLNDLRAGVFVADAAVDSKDMTAPKLPQRNFQDLLTKDAGLVERPSGPKTVIGYNPADTSERTVERPGVRKKAPAPRPPVSRVGGVSPSSDPYEEGRLHLAMPRDMKTESADNLQAPKPVNGDRRFVLFALVALLFVMLIVGGLVMAAIL